MIRFPRRPRALRVWVPCLAFGTLLISGCTRMWLVNLYSKRPDIGTSPVFYSVLPAPEPEPEPPCGGPGQMVCIESTGRHPAF